MAVVSGLAVTLIALKMSKGHKSIAKLTLWSALGLFVVSQGVLCISDMYYTSKVKERSKAFNNEIPHFCLLVLDTTRRDHLSCYGYPFQTSPNLDRIASEGLLCLNAYSATNWTPPGHISIFTGKYPQQHGNGGEPFMPDTLMSFTEVLNEQGYFCVALYNNPLAGKNINLTQGFDVDVGVWCNRWVYPAWVRLRDWLQYKRDNGSQSTFPMAYKTFEWIERKGGHLFLYINALEPHLWYLTREPYFSEYIKDIRVDEIPDLDAVNRVCRCGRTIQDSSKFKGWNEESYQYLRAAYDSEITYMDYYVGVFADKMRRAQLLDETLLVVTADHGEFLGERWTVGHPEMMYNPVLRIPQMLRYPAKIEPAVMEEPVSNVDVFPTVLGLMGLERCIPVDVGGVDILMVRPDNDRSILSARCSEIDGCYGFVAGPSKLILHSGWADHFLQHLPFDTLLYDVGEDPEELIDLHSTSPQLCAMMLDELRSWVDSTRVEADSSITVSEETIKAIKALGYVN